MEKKQIALFVIGAAVLLLFFRKKGATQVAGNGQEENIGGITFNTTQLPPLLSPTPDQYNYLFLPEVMKHNGPGNESMHGQNPWIVGDMVYMPLIGTIPT